MRWRLEDIAIFMNDDMNAYIHRYDDDDEDDM
jgi:hypothetical protein